MSTFINKKEQVLELELTPYGKHKFSQGDLQPTYYSFYDDDILYDGHYGIYAATQQEPQNNIVTRIKDTQRLNVQANYTSSVGTTLSTTNVGKAEFINLSEANLKFMQPLGSNSAFSKYVPAWHISTLEKSADFSGSATYATNLAVPTLSASLDMVYHRSTVSGKNEEGEDEDFIHYDLVVQDRLVIDVLELNTIFKANGNYDIEVFKERSGESGELEQLGFINTNSPDADALEVQTDPQFFNSTLGGNEESIAQTFPTLNEKFVEYYLSVRVDDEIRDIKAPRGENLYQAGKINFPEDICKPT